ncbi:hypothetical protein QQS21_000656 [Conoideocrella luteorostrata]|uniref:NmrA-like domain-containing protein n=1 Tax=Conoideocrella luteorostrata TaxID=1105319 RepID=A0AAJ0FYA5_9HYPO|nr:hypothetical protein QQS21_000656 [Conoideocrella luteorostrata]
MPRTILVTGATGKQGRAVVRSLINKQDSPFRILALTRDASSSSAQRLASTSSLITLLQGNLDDTDAIFEKATQTDPSIWGVFSVQTVQQGKKGPALEEKQGTSLIDSALKHGVQHFVYSSVDRGGDNSQNNPTKVPHFKSKHNIEAHLMKSAKGSMTWTILRPVAFMDNFDGAFFGKIFASGWKDHVKSRPLQLVATEDIGVLAARSFQEQDVFAGMAVSIAGDELSYDEMAAVYSDVMKAQVPTTFGFVVSVLTLVSDELGEMLSFFEKDGFGADLKKSRELNPGIQDLRSWLQRQSS